MLIQTIRIRTGATVTAEDTTDVSTIQQDTAQTRHHTENIRLRTVHSMTLPSAIRTAIH